MLKLSWLLPLAILFQEMSTLKKRRYEEIKKGKCPKPRKKRKSETRGKNRQVSNSRIRGTKYPSVRKKIQSISFSPSFKRARKVCIPLKEQE